MRWKTAGVVHASDESVPFRQPEGHCRETGQPFVFYIAEYLDETRKWGFPPSLLESWGCTHLGSPVSTVLIGLDKESTKEVLRRAAVPTLRSFVAQPGYPDAHDRAAAIGFPPFVKPLREGGHLGVHDDSIVRDMCALDRAALRVMLSFRQPTVVEEFIGVGGMREFSVGVVGSAEAFNLLSRSTGATWPPGRGS